MRPCSRKRVLVPNGPSSNITRTPCFYVGNAYFGVGQVLLTLLHWSFHLIRGCNVDIGVVTIRTPTKGPMYVNKKQRYRSHEDQLETPAL